VDGPLTTPRLTLRPFAPEDAAALFAIFRVGEVGRFVGGAHDTIAASEELIAVHGTSQRRNGFSYWAVEERGTGALVGEVGLQLLERTGPDVEIGWVIAKPAWGRGYATEAARAWLRAGFQTLGLDEIVAVVRPENEASHRVARRLGMEPAGRRHVYDHDLDVYVARPPR
jgi:[ribosomal protein S5]-alanine N-acetyltransferase